MDNTRKIDGLRWLTLAMQILVGTSCAYVYCLSVYVGPLAEEFGWDPEIIIASYTLMMAMGLPGSIVGGYLRKKFGNRFVLKVGGIGFAAAIVISAFSVNAWMYVIMTGGLGAFCMYVVYVAQLENIGELFPDKRGMAMGIGVGGISIGTAMIVPVAEWLSRSYDLMHGIAIQGIVYGGLVFIVGFLMVEAPKNYRPKGWNSETFSSANEGIEEVGSKNISWKQVLKTPAFYILLLAIVAIMIFTTGFQSNNSLINQAALGVDSASGAWIYTAFMIASGVGSFVLGIQSDLFGGPLKTLIIWSIIVTLVGAILLCIGVSTVWMYLIVTVAIGILGGGVLAVVPMLLMNEFGNMDFGIIYGMFIVAPTVASIFGPQLAVTKDITQFFFIGVVCSAIGLNLFMIASKMFVKNKR